ncbi:MAG TPA: glycosyltransferase [Ohtaekwangia sp.]
MVYLLAIFITVYAVLILQLIRGWYRLQSVRQHGDTERFLSVVVAFRNESRNIGLLLDDLKKQQYQPYEILLVDDHSGDDSVEIARSYSRGDSRIRVLTNEGNGKKQALATGIRQAIGEIIVTTDADCRVGNLWLVQIANAFQDGQVMMTSGAVVIQEDQSFFSHLQAIEFASLIGSGAALIGLKKPTMCNGANLAFRKQAFDHVGGYSDNLQIASGDDEFLMRKILAVYKNSIRFIKSSEAIVTTTASPSTESFFQQRFRWAGKWRHNSSGQTRILAVFIFLFQVMLLVALGLVIFSEGRMALVALAVLLTRMILEFCFLEPVCRFLNVHWRWSAFLFLQLAYPFYVVFTGLFSNLTTITWKGRKI